MVEENAFLGSPANPALMVLFKLKKNVPLFTLEPPRDQSARLRHAVHQCCSLWWKPQLLVLPLHPGLSGP